MATGLLNLGINMSGVPLTITGAPLQPVSYTPKVIFVTETGAYLTEYASGLNLGLKLYYNGTNISIYDPDEDSIPLTVTLPQGIGIITELDKGAEFYPDIERAVNRRIYGFTEDLEKVDLTDPINKVNDMRYITESGIVTDTQSSNGLSVDLVEAYKVYSDNSFEADIQASCWPSCEYVSAGVFKTPAVVFTALNNVLNNYSINGLYIVCGTARGFTSYYDYIMQLIKAGNIEGDVDRVTVQALAFNPADSGNTAKNINVDFEVRIVGTVSVS